MRIATFNILSGRSPQDDRVHEGRYVEAIKRLDADLLGLQEVDRNQPRSEHADLTGIAAAAMGAVDHQFVAALSGTPGAIWAAATGDEQPDAAAYGVAFLSRFPVTGWQVVRLPAAPGRVPHRWHGAVLPDWVRDEPRVAVVAEVEAPDGPLRVATTHLSFLRLWNVRQLRVLLRGLGEVRDVPLVLMGDLNMGRRTAERVTGLDPLVTGATFPASSPTLQIDHILASPDLRARSGGPLPLPMSDHCALVADI